MNLGREKIVIKVSSNGFTDEKHLSMWERIAKHIGWVSSYVDLDYVDNPGHIPAVGIDIPAAEAWNKGIGTQALRQFLGYLKKRGYKSAYTQTWSGNHAMLRIAEKLGFTEIVRKKDYRMVDGKLYDAITLRIDL